MQDLVKAHGAKLGKKTCKWEELKRMEIVLLQKCREVSFCLKSIWVLDDSHDYLSNFLGFHLTALAMM